MFQEVGNAKYCFFPTCLNPIKKASSSGKLDNVLTRSTGDRYVRFYPINYHYKCSKGSFVLSQKTRTTKETKPILHGQRGNKLKGECFCGICG